MPATRFLLALAVSLLLGAGGAHAGCSDLPRERAPFRVPVTATVDRVRRCRVPVVCLSAVTRARYAALGGIAAHLSRRLLLSEVAAGAGTGGAGGGAGSVSLFAAGQQAPGGAGGASGITGQRRGYRAGWGLREASARAELNPASLAARVLGAGVLGESPAATLVFDPSFDYQFLLSTKDKIVDAYAQYVLGKTGPATRAVYLAGHSRGGCLALRVAQQVTRERPTLRVVVAAFDPVCAGPLLQARPEFGVSRRRVPNPLRKGYSVHVTDMEKRFPHRECLAVKSFLSGEAVFGLPIHAVGHKGFTQAKGALRTAAGRPWYEQRFCNDSHALHLRAALQKEAVRHLEKALEQLPCTCTGA